MSRCWQWGVCEETPGLPCAGHSLFQPAPTAELSTLLRWGHLGGKVFRRDENFTEGRGRTEKMRNSRANAKENKKGG